MADTQDSRLGRPYVPKDLGKHWSDPDVTEFAVKLPIHGQSHDAPFETIFELAATAESAGFSSLYVIDHLLVPPYRLGGRTNADIERPYFLDAWTTLAAVAARTKTIRLGPQVTPIGLRHPVFVAKWGATVDRISNGRLRLGVGLGHQEIEYTSYGLPFPPFRERYDAMVEGVEIIRRLWTEEGPLTYEGKYYSVTDVSFWPKPIQTHLPIWFGGTSKAIMRAVARLGDGWFPAFPQHSGFSPAFYRENLAAIREDAIARGRTERIGSGVLLLTAVSEDPAELERFAAMLRRRAEYADYSTQDFKDKGILFMGSPDEICRQIEPYVEAGVEEITLGFHPLDDTDAIRRALDLYARKVMPRFQ